MPTLNTEGAKFTEIGYKCKIGKGWGKWDSPWCTGYNCKFWFWVLTPLLFLRYILKKGTVTSHDMISREEKLSTMSAKGYYMQLIKMLQLLWFNEGKKQPNGSLIF